jgi:uncharacterized membrane protein YcaP (DUF421 family)
VQHGPKRSLIENPVIRMLVVIILVAAGIRLIFSLLYPVWPYLAAALVLFAVLRLIAWHRNHW